jgi:hypothetical protein
MIPVRASYPLHHTSFFVPPNNFSLKTNEIGSISLDVIHFREQLHKAALFAESLKEELLERTTDLMAVQEENEVLHGMQLHATFWRYLDDHREDERDLQTTLGGSGKGRGKWKRMTEKLFKIRILKPLLISLTFKHTRSNVYMAQYMVHCMARVTDLQHGLTLYDIGNLRNIEHTVPRAERLLCSSLSLKRVFTKVEKEMSLEI